MTRPLRAQDPCGDCDRRTWDLAGALIDMSGELADARRAIADARDLLERGQWQAARAVISAAKEES